VAESVADPFPYYSNNVAKGLVLLAVMESRNVRRIVFSSTCATYGNPVRVPWTRTTRRRPSTPTGTTKRAFENALADHARAGRLRAVALRYFNAAGCHPTARWASITTRRST
jgi:UDP-glucose 4-epimerase